jgi:hypothetical protein
VAGPLNISVALPPRGTYLTWPLKARGMVKHRGQNTVCMCTDGCTTAVVCTPLAAQFLVCHKTGVCAPLRWFDLGRQGPHSKRIFLHPAHGLCRHTLSSPGKQQHCCICMLAYEPPSAMRLLGLGCRHLIEYFFPFVCSYQMKEEGVLSCGQKLA